MKPWSQHHDGLGYRMGIVRGPISADNFTVVANHWARTDRLSYKAKGLLLAISSHAAGYRLTVEQLVDQSADSRTAIRSGLSELEAAGYLYRERHRDPKTGRHGAYEWYLVEDPHGEADPSTDYHQSTNRAVGTDQAVSDETAGQAQSTFSGGGSRPLKKTREEDHGEDQVLGGSVSPQTPPARRSAKHPSRQWRPRVPQTVKQQGPAAVAEYVNALTEERERIKQAVAAGSVPF